MRDKGRRVPCKGASKRVPDMKGHSNFLYMPAFAEAWPEEPIVQQLAGQIPWFHNCTLLDTVKDPEARAWYARATVEHRLSSTQ